MPIHSSSRQGNKQTPLFNLTGIYNNLTNIPISLDKQTATGEAARLVGGKQTVPQRRISHPGRP
jgi:hypothetical protein